MFNGNLHRRESRSPSGRNRMSVFVTFDTNAFSSSLTSVGHKVREICLEGRIGNRNLRKRMYGVRKLVLCPRDS